MMFVVISTLLIFSPSLSVSLSPSSSFSACPTSIKSTPKMIICLRQIILGKAIYRITIALLYPPSQTSSLEYVYLCVCIYVSVLVQPQNNVQRICFCMPTSMCTHTHLSLSWSISTKSLHAVCFKKDICIIVWYHWTLVQVHSLFKSTNMYSPSKISVKQSRPEHLFKSNIGRDGFKLSARMKVFIFYTSTMEERRHCIQVQFKHLKLSVSSDLWVEGHEFEKTLQW